VRWTAFRIRDVVRREVTMLHMVVVQGSSDGPEIIPAATEPRAFPVTVYHAAADDEKQTPHRNERHTIGSVPNPGRLSS
jgi:hypothetical protein